MLVDWKNNEERKPLVIQGARQTGKTSSVEHFAAEHYKSFISINFIEMPEYRTIVADGYSVEKIIKRITLINPSARFVDGSTLIFFDEVQDFPDITTSLKFFCQDGRCDVICSGSMLGVTCNLVNSISVGYSTTLELRPMDAEEFLWALGYTEAQIDDLYQSMLHLKALDKTTHEVFSSLFFDYCITGGLPEPVALYCRKRNFEGQAELHAQLVADYRRDVAKYHGPLDAARILSVLDSIPTFLSQKNKKFKVTAIGKNASLEGIEPYIRWLEDAGLVYRCHCLSVPALPLYGNYERSKYKLYFFDTGLLLSMLEEEAMMDFRVNRNFGIYKGGIWENIIAVEFARCRHRLFYYKKDNSTLEEDFFLRSKNHVVPVEVKATDGRSKSLSTLISSSAYPEIEYGVKLTAGNIGHANGIYTFPHFLAFLLPRFLSSLD